MDVPFTLYAFPKRAEGWYALCRPEVDLDESSLTGLTACIGMALAAAIFGGKKALEVGWVESADVYCVQPD